MILMLTYQSMKQLCNYCAVLAVQSVMFDNANECGDLAVSVASLM